jgi:hypothetical protein
MAPAFDFQDLMLMPVGRPLPEFVLAPIDDDELGFSSADLVGQVALLMCSHPGAPRAGRSMQFCLILLAAAFLCMG